MGQRDLRVGDAPVERKSVIVLHIVDEGFMRLRVVGRPREFPKIARALPEREPVAAGEVRSPQLTMAERQLHAGSGTQRRVRMRASARAG